VQPGRKSPGIRCCPSDRAAGSCWPAHRHHWRQFIEVDLDCGGEVLRRGTSFGDAYRYRLADVAHLFGGQYRLHGWLEPWQARYGNDRLHADKILRNEDRRFVTSRLANGSDARVGERTADESQITHAGKADIRDELALAAQVALILQPWCGSADALGGCGLPHPTPFPLARCVQPSAY
jgi:hypothetical protein